MGLGFYDLNQQLSHGHIMGYRDRSMSNAELFFELSKKKAP